MIDPTQNESGIVADQNSDDAAAQAAAAQVAQAQAAQLLYDETIADLTGGAQYTAATDTLLIDLTGGGIGVSNWIDNAVYFQSNVVNAGTAQATLDTAEHHTSWMAGATGMLVFDPNDTAITAITQTVSQYLNLDPVDHPNAAGTYADGLAALAALVKPADLSQGVFSAATSATDPITHVSYWNELYVATGAPVTSTSNGQQVPGVPTSQLATLASVLGTGGSIGLTGSGNAGASVSGSAVTDQATYTTGSNASAGVASGEVASVDLQIDTAGDITTDQANGSYVIDSTPEGGPSAGNTYVDEAGSAQTLMLNHGALTDDGTAVAQSGGQAYAAVFAQAGDTVGVTSGDPGNYWLGIASGQATLNASGATGNVYFLTDAASAGSLTGGSGFNIAQVTDGAPVTVNLKSDKLQEAIGGAGDATLDAAGTIWNVFLQGGSGNNILIGGEAADALSGGTGDDLIEAGPGGSVVHAGIYMHVNHIPLASNGGVW